MSISNPSRAGQQGYNTIAGHSSVQVFTCRQSGLLKSLSASCISGQKYVMKARIRYALRWLKFKSISDHNIKFQDQSSKCYHYIKAHTHMFSMVQFSGSQPVGLSDIAKHLWIYRSARCFLHTEYCPTYRTHYGFLRLQKVGIYCSLPWALLHIPQRTQPVSWCTRDKWSKWFRKGWWTILTLYSAKNGHHGWHQTNILFSPKRESTTVSFKEQRWRTSLVAQWLRICLPMQGTRVRALVQEDPTCCGATKPVHHNYWACALEPVSHNY